MIENIPDSVKPLLNEFIRKGKRLSLQHDGILKKYINKNKEHQERIIEKIRNISSPTFKVTEDGSLKIPTTGVTSVVHGNFNAITISGIYNLEVIFGLDGSDPNNPLYIEYTKWYNELKKEIALDFFLYKKFLVSFNRVLESFRRKELKLNDLLRSVEKIWNANYLPSINNRIQYADPKYGAYVDCIVKAIFPEKRTLIIQTCSSSPSQAKHVQYDMCKWDKAFHLTQLYRYATILITIYRIPDIWKENRIDFYT